MKRFTETQKWEDPWFRKMKPELKLLWQWLCDRCDNAGIIDPDLDLASFQIGYQYPSNTLSEYGERLVKLKGGKWFIPKFIDFQYGKLSTECKAHNPIFQSLEKHGIERGSIGYQYPLRIGKGLGKGKGTLEELKSFAVEIGLPESDGEVLFHKWEGNGWLNGKNQIKDWKATMRQWKSSGWMTSQKANGSKPKHAGITENLHLTADF